MLVVTFFWAVGHPLGSIILRYIHPFQLAALNLVIGCAGLFIFLLISGKLRGLRSFTAGETLRSMALGVFAGIVLANSARLRSDVNRRKET